MFDSGTSGRLNASVKTIDKAGGILMFAVSMHSAAVYATDDFTVSVIVSAWRVSAVSGILILALILAVALRFGVVEEKTEVKRGFNVSILVILVLYVMWGISGYNFFSPRAEATLHTSHWRMDVNEVPGLEYVEADNSVYTFNFEDCSAEKARRVYKHTYYDHTGEIVWTDAQGKSRSAGLTAEKTERHGAKVFGGTLYECTIHWGNTVEFIPVD